MPAVEGNRTEPSRVDQTFASSTACQNRAHSPFKPGMNQITYLADTSLTDLGFGSAVGAAAGYATKKLARLMALAVGVLILALQALSYAGWVDVDWAAIAQWTGAQGPTFADQFRSALVTNVPFSGGFMGGFTIGFTRT